MVDRSVDTAPCMHCVYDFNIIIKYTLIIYYVHYPLPICHFYDNFKIFKHAVPTPN